MARRMSVALTLPAGTKTVTRRHPDTWGDTAVGDELDLIEKGMGLPKGARQIVVASVRVVATDVRPLVAGLTPDEIAAEGFDPEVWTPRAWARWWANGHGFVGYDVRMVDCRRIQWEYLQGEDRP